MRKILIALGGNALETEGSSPTAMGQIKAIELATSPMVALVKQGNQLVITHGNGPQVGRILLQNDAGKDITPAQPLDVCGAMTQGAIGYHIQNVIGEKLRKNGIVKPVVSLVTQVEVSAEDNAFGNPTKPIGQFYTEAEAKQVEKEKGFIFKEDSGRGWRRVVPSPKPIKVIELEAAKTLIDSGAVVVFSGGGGIPVVKDEERGYVGIEAVIDKDLSAALIAADLKVDDLMILTAVDKVALNFGKPTQQLIDQMTVSEAKQYAEEGHFAPGSMLPKIEAAIMFIEKHPSGRAIITSLESAGQIGEEKVGTIIIAG